MTVIVATPKAMYSDSLCTSGETNFPSIKVYRVRGELIGVAGTVSHIEHFMRWYMGTRRKPLDVADKDDFSAVVVNRKGIWDFHGGTMPDRVLRDYHGIGVGWAAAHAALLCGKSPTEAIEVACKVTHLCSLPVQEFKL